jgi:hypothetical protein
MGIMIFMKLPAGRRARLGSAAVRMALQLAAAVAALLY